MALSWGTFAAVMIGAASVRMRCNDVRNDVCVQDQGVTECQSVIEKPLPPDRRNDAAPATVRGAVLFDHAMRLFTDAMTTFDAGAAGLTLPFPVVRRNYAALARDGGWPAPSSDKALSQGLIRAGCRRISPKDKGYPRTGDKRPVLIEFPMEAIR